jgi:hypothetical protein
VAANTSGPWSVGQVKRLQALLQHGNRMSHQTRNRVGPRHAGVVADHFDADTVVQHIAAPVAIALGSMDALVVHGCEQPDPAIIDKQMRPPVPAQLITIKISYPRQMSTARLLSFSITQT